MRSRVDPFRSTTVNKWARLDVEAQDQTSWRVGISPHSEDPRSYEATHRSRRLVDVDPDYLETYPRDQRLIHEGDLYNYHSRRSLLDVKLCDYFDATCLLAVI